ncbi:MAG: hypothetical protein EKK29_05905 [Hyphomicrobiales bacterium]|nr:MAG: hypothetical protein EKK29_05905 [Hyphomicrobiales bacterium]
MSNNENFPTIEALATEHDRVTREIEKLPNTDAGDEERERLNNRLWSLRALMGATASKSKGELLALARILRDEYTRDANFECHVPGSARDLARALAEGVMAMQVAA